MLSDEDTVKFFARMQHLYAHKWSTAYGPPMEGKELSPAAKQWRYDLRDYSREQVAYGLQRIVDLRLEWPPGPIEFMNLCDGVPTVAQVLDRDRDYGPVCRAIRQRMDWYNLDAMSTEKRRAIGSQQFETALTRLRSDGTVKSLARQMVGVGVDRQALV
jgi:hypothetical protein